VRQADSGSRSSAGESRRNNERIADLGTVQFTSPIDDVHVDATRLGLGAKVHPN